MRRIPLIAILLLCAGAMCCALSLGSVAPPHFKSAHAQLSLTGAGLGVPGGGGGGYQGPGDLGITNATLADFYNCGRVAKASLANTGTSLCDLIATTGGAAVGTLRASATGFVDLSAYFSGGVTPAAACAAASGGSCQVSKRYDQIGSLPEANGTTAPSLVFAALNGLPCSKNPTGGAGIQFKTGNFTQALPFVQVGLAERTTNNGTISRIMDSTANLAPTISFTPTTNGIEMSAGTAISHTAAGYDGAFHAIIGDFDLNANADSALVIDGSAVVTGATGSTGYSANGIQELADGGGSGLEGYSCESEFWTGFMNSTDYGKLNTNIHSAAYGWNF